jgi:predicted glycogen debranching enzyme
VNDPIRRILSRADFALEGPPQLSCEWLVTNGLGGYASGTVTGMPTRRYHGLLIAALPAPVGRIFLLAQLSEQIRLPDGRSVRFGGETWLMPAADAPKAGRLVEFRLEAGLPVWHYQIDDVLIEKTVFLVHQQNTTHVAYRLLEGPPSVRLKLLPLVHFRPHDAPVNTPLHQAFQFQAIQRRYEISTREHLPTLRMQIHGQRTAFTFEPQTFSHIIYPIEGSRGYDAKGELWTPGYFRVDLSRSESAVIVASTEPWEMIESLRPDEAAQAERQRRARLLAEADPRAHESVAAELVLAADQFLIRPAARREDAAIFEASGDEVRSVIAGYHWFTDWGRDTMISLEGLALVTGRHAEAGHILRTFAHYIRDGLIPNLFPEGQRNGLYHTADATLWFFHALSRYLAYTHDRATLQLLLPQLHDIFEHHVHGTRFGIGVDPADGLLRQGEEGYQLTWMDAKVGDWVVTPRRGKTVEINALWYNALRLMANWFSQLEGSESAAPVAELAEKVKASFNRRFWFEHGGHLYDVVDGPQGDDPACRPNQIFSFSLEHPVLDEAHWLPVLETVRRELWTPVGLRTLSPSHPDYKSRYDGDLRARDAAYHQGTVWAWLIGPFADAWLRVFPQDIHSAQDLLRGFEPHLDEACIGTISEVFDAMPPYTPRGCAAQAWSVAEVLRAMLKTHAAGKIEFHGSATTASFATIGEPTAAS